MVAFEHFASFRGVSSRGCQGNVPSGEVVKREGSGSRFSSFACLMGKMFGYLAVRIHLRWRVARFFAETSRSEYTQDQETIIIGRVGG